MNPFFVLLRPKHWTKNILVVMPLLFSGQLDDAQLLMTVIAATLGMCLLASAGYIANDLRDVSADARHPTKKSRPLPAGRITPRQACLTGLSAGTIGLGLILAVTGPLGCAAALGYVVAQVAYCSGAKRLPLLEMGLIAAGFVARLLIGADAAASPISNWIIVSTVFLVLFFVTVKRWQEQKRCGARARDVLTAYPPLFLEHLAWLLAGLSVSVYVAYCLLIASLELFVLTAVPVVFAIGRVLLLASGRSRWDDPLEIVLRDRPALAAGLIWLLAVGSWHIFIG